MFFLSETSFFFSKTGRITSKVRVEDEVNTNEDRVDMEADSTRTMIRATITGARSESMVGTTLSNKTLLPLICPPSFIWLKYSLPKPPRK